MGRLRQGILGGVSGKVGNVVGSSWKGIATVKAMPLSVANPRTAEQIAQRTKMTNVVAFSRTILASIIKPLNDRFAGQMSGFNIFIKRNIDLFSTAVPSPAASLQLASGKMVAVNPSAVAYNRVGEEVIVNYPNSLPDSFAQATDKVYLVAKRVGSDEIAVSSGVAVRSDGVDTVVFQTPSTLGDVVHVWLVFLRADGTVVSNTGYGSDVI